MKFLNPIRQSILIIGTWNTDPIICFGCLIESGTFKFIKIVNNNISDLSKISMSSSNVVELSWAA